MTSLKLAIQKSGRLSEASLRLLSECGISLSLASSRGDRLRVKADNFPLELFFLRDDDIPGYIEDGIIDVGIVGLNTVKERELVNPQGSKSLKPLLPLAFGKCRLAIAIPRKETYASINSLAGKRIATSYPAILRDFLARNSVSCIIHEISGSVEIAPSMGLADAVCDLVSSGSTLAANGLTEVENVLHSEATLYALSTYDTEEKNGEKVDPHSPLSRLMFRMRSVLRAKQSKYVVLNAPNEAIPLICQLLPGVTSPTIVPLAIPDWSAIHSVIAEEKFWEVIEELTGAGAQGILVMPIEKIVSDEPPLSKSHRRISYLRKTNETKISLTLNLDGKGESRIKSGLGFLDHMLTLFAKHSNIDLDLEAEGDLQVDEHHTVEDISIALGEGVAKALGDKRSISRYAFLLPMDEAQAEIALDLSGRAFLLWQADFKREYVGDVPTELWQHFFRSFADALKCNLHIKVVGDNDHHKIEAIFKGVARALKDGIKRDFLNTNIPSTKGVI